jgi:2-(1,2-epoxy-1,2-dihydrophenyl)acetyl-CoA isomerase
MTHVTDYKTSCYTLQIEGALAVIHFFGDIYELGTCISLKDHFLSQLQSINDSPKIRALLLLNSPGVLGDENYCRFISNAIEARVGSKTRHKRDAKYSGSSHQIEKQNITLNQIVGETSNFRKLLLVGFEGDVAPPFFGVGLAADYRFGTDEMTFQPSHIKLGIPPGGGLGFFLPKLVGRRKTRDLLFSDEPTSAHDLHRLGLLDAHLSSEGFRDECVNIADGLEKIPLPAIMEIKSIINFNSRDLMEFLEFEGLAMERAIVRKQSQLRTTR